MAEKFIISTSALIYDNENRMLFITRGSNEKDQPDIQAYPGGKAEYSADNFDKELNNIVGFVEINLKREIKEETNIELEQMDYFHSHCFTNSDGDKVVLIAFICPLPDNSKIKVDGEDTVGYGWIKEEEVLGLNTIKIVKHVYELGFQKLREKRYHQHIEVAGLVINDKNEFLLLKERSTNKFIFPHGPVENLPGRTWEILEKNLIRNVFSQTAIEVAEGVIPFTDKEFIGKDGFEKIIEFFICRYSRGEAIVTRPEEYLEVIWRDINKMKEEDFKPLVYTVFKKAFEFISKINN